MNQKGEEVEETHLRAWEEVVGVYMGLENRGYDVVVILSCSHRDLKIVFPVNGPEARILEEELVDWLGVKVAILKTDDKLKPVIVRVLGSRARRASR